MIPIVDCKRPDCPRGARSRGLCDVHYNQEHHRLSTLGQSWHDSGAEDTNYFHETFVHGVAKYDIPLDYLPPQGEGEEYL